MRTTVLLVSLVLAFAHGIPSENNVVEFAATVVDDADKKLDPTACSELGFPSVACSTCQTIDDVVADKDLSAECLQCCHETKRSTKKYASATMVYNPRLLRADAELRGFVEKRAKDHAKLTLQPRVYANAELLMLEEGATASDAHVVSIGRWKVDSIADYLHEHL